MNDIKPNVQAALDKVDRWRELRGDIDRMKFALTDLHVATGHLFSTKTASRMYADELRRCEAEIAELEESMK